MKYILSKRTFGNIPEIELTEEEFFRLKEARDILSNALAIEEKYEIVVTN